MWDGNHDLSRRFRLDEENQKPIGIWSDETIMWVADMVGDKIYAYNMWKLNDQQMVILDGSRIPKEDFDNKIDRHLKDAENTNPSGLWSNGTTMWVSDYVNKKLYAYNLPRSTSTSFSDPRDASLSALVLSGSVLNPVFSSENMIYTTIVGHDVASTAVTTTPGHSEATVDISLASNSAEGSSGVHRVDLKEGRNIIRVDVTAESDESAWTYLVVVTRAEAVL